MCWIQEKRKGYAGMKIVDLIAKESISIDEGKMSKLEAIDRLVTLMENSGNLVDREDFKGAVIAREESGTTGIGEGVAIPHGKSAGITRAGISTMVVKEGLDYDSLDGEDTKLFFMIGVPKDSADEHLKVLARLSTILMDESFREDLINASDREVFLDIIDKKEKEKFPDEYVQPSSAQEKVGYELLAVTACPTGIAHTYMAAESLANKAKEMGISIKVETNGSSGVENEITEEDIKYAKGVIIAADKNVEMDRFDGLPMVQVKVADGIHKPKELIEKALGDAPIYKATGEKKSGSKDIGNESMGRRIYKHLMNGVSNMLPFVTGGGILIALAFLFDVYEIDPANFGSNTPLAATLNTIGGTAFSFMLPILAGFIAFSIADRPGLVAGFVGGALASTGGSGFLGALIAGFVAGGIVQLLKKVLSVLPKSFEGVKPVLLYPLLGTLLMGLVIIFVVNPTVSVINDGIFDGLNNMGSSSKVLLGLVLGGMMSVDMGGPVNKAAYVFGTASLAQGTSGVMAAVMAGGMVPPLAIALATVFFKHKFTKRERQQGLTNFIMGASFITEGAIPFAAADPVRVLPSCIVGSALAGGLSMLFDCTIRAPHGGLWVLGVISKPAFYVAAVAAGSILSMFLLGLIKKTVVEEI